MTSPEMSENPFAKEYAELNVEVFGTLLSHFSDPDNKFIDPELTGRFNEHHAQGRISVLSLDSQAADTSYVYKLEEVPSHVAIVLTFGYCLGFNRARMYESMSSAVDTAALVRRSVEMVEELTRQGKSFMSHEEFMARAVNNLLR